HTSPSQAALSRRCSKISRDSSRLRASRIHAEYSWEEEKNSAGVAVAIYSISVFVNVASVRNLCLQILILSQTPHLSVSYGNQVVWRIPDVHIHQPPLPCVGQYGGDRQES